MIGQKTYDQACDWIVRLDSGSASAAERAQFVRWLNRRPEHAVAFEEMSQLWARIDTLGPAAEQGLGVEQPNPVRTRPATPVASFRAVTGLAAALVFCLLAWVVMFAPAPGSNDKLKFITARDQHHEIQASDGSRISLEPSTSLTMEFTRGERGLSLQRGAATFQVTDDPERPFRVVTPEATFTALGTVFRVDRSLDRLQLAVLEGAVSFQLPGAGYGHEHIDIQAGQRLDYHPETGSVTVHP